MNTVRNTVSLIGHLGMDPEVREFGENNSVARFRIATNESYKNKDGEWVENTTWHSIVAWGAKANLCKQLLKKGSRVVVRGKLVNDSYETKEGEKRFRTEVSLRDFLLLSRATKTETKK